MRIAWPTIISELGDSIYSITDVYFVSRVGTTALAAVGVGSYLSWVLSVVVALFSTGSLIFVAQSYGARKVEESRHILSEVLVTATVVTSCVAIVLQAFAVDVVKLITGPNPELTEGAVSYFSIRSLGLPALTVALVADSAVRAVGATKLSMVAFLTSIALNAVLDPIMIFGLFGFPRMGVAGAALATVASIAYMIPLEMLFLMRLGLTPTPSLKFNYITKVLRVSLPSATERLIFSIGNNIYAAFIARCGDVALAAHQVGVRIESFIYMPGFAFSIAASTLVGQRVGAWEVDEGKRVGMEAARLSAIFMAVLGLLAALTAPYIVAPFSPSEEVSALASTYLLLAGLSEPGLALAMTLGGAIRGAGNTLIPLIISISGLYMLRVLPAYILTPVAGVVGAWIAMFVDVYLRGIAFLIIYVKYFSKLVRKLI